MSHDKHRVHFFEKRFEFGRNHSRLYLCSLFNALAQPSEELKALCRVHSRLVSASAQRHVKRDSRVLLVFGKRRAAEAHAYGYGRLNRGRHLQISYTVENIKPRFRELLYIFVSENEQITVLFGLSYYAAHRLRPFRQRVVDNRHRRRFFALFRYLEKFVVVVHKNVRDNGLLLIELYLQLLVVGYVEEIKNGKFSFSYLALVRYDREIFRRERNFDGPFRKNVLAQFENGIKL